MRMGRGCVGVLSVMAANDREEWGRIVGKLGLLAILLWSLLWRLNEEILQEG